jgi:Tfp pilus assembly protein PilX
MPTIVFGLVLMSVLSVAALRTSGDEQRSVRAFRESAGALYAAEAGLRFWIANWATSGSGAMNPGDSVVLNGGWTGLNYGAQYRAVIHRVDNGPSRTFLIVVQGRGPGKLAGQRSVEAVVTTSAPTFQYAAYTSGTLKFSGASATDTVAKSYNSITGTSTGMDGNLMSGGAMSLTGVITGDVTSASTITFGGGSKALGDTTINATGLPTYANPACPVTPYTPTANVTKTSSGGSMTYNASTGVLTGSGGPTITLSGQSVYYFSSINIGPGTLRIDPAGGAVTVYVSGAFSITGGGVVNTESSPTKLALSGCGTNTSDWKLTGSSDAYMTVYAPTHKFTISGGGDLWGALISASLDASGGSSVTFDEALIGSTTTMVLIAGSWTELTLY